ncbi:MAG TPA: Mur ligase family protein, partial [Treponemataceae bacterium]|nr:Mur ligase family protein [Treponemataceae bacterium]
MTMMCKEKLLDAVQGKELFSKRLKNKKFSFTSVVIDSNDVVAGSLFVPLLGQFQDGHIYVEAAVLKGATVVLVCSSSIEEFFSTYEKLNSLEVCIIAVENTLYALQALAAAYVREFPNLIKIAITGSSGKTTTKELIASVLKQKYNLVMTEGNLNSETGLPLSVLNIRKEHEVGVFEIGMNRTDEIAELTDVLFPHIAVITNVGTSHIGILGTKDEIAQQKKQIFKNFSNDSVAFIPEHDDYASFLAENVRGKIIYYGKRQTEGVSNPRFLGIR